MVFKKRPKKRKYKAKEHVLAVQKSYKGMKLTKNEPQKAKMSAKKLYRLWYLKKGLKSENIRPNDMFQQCRNDIMA